MAFDLGQTMAKHPWLWMTGIGAGAGGLGALGGLLGGGGGHRARFKQVPRFSPGVSQGIESLFSQGMQNYNPAAIEQRARQQFQSQTIPSLAERFTSFGGGGQRSSAFQSALGMAGSDLESQLAMLRSQMGLNQLQMGMTPTFETAFMPRQQSGLEALGSSLGQGVGSLASILPFLLAL